MKESTLMNIFKDIESHILNSCSSLNALETILKQADQHDLGALISTQQKARYSIVQDLEHVYRPELKLVEK